MQAWQDQLPSIVEALGEPRLAEVLDAALRRVAPFDLTVILAYPSGDRRPLLLHDGLGSMSSKEVMRRYLEGTYLLDAVYTACRHEFRCGLYRLHDIAPDSFFEGEYYNSPDVHPCISLESGSLAEEIVYLARLEDGTYLAYSLMRSNGHERFSNEEMRALRACEPVVKSVLKRQWARPAEALETSPDDDGQSTLERAFRSFGAGTLTLREQMVVSLMLRGHSTLSTASVLGISEGTVKNHRKAIYARLGISSQSELFSLFITHLLAKDRVDPEKVKEHGSLPHR